MMLDSFLNLVTMRHNCSVKYSYKRGRNLLKVADPLSEDPPATLLLALITVEYFPSPIKVIPSLFT